MVWEANRRGIAIPGTVAEVGSGMNGQRRTLARILSDAAVTVIVVEYRDRLARVGVEYLDAALSATGRGVVVLHEDEATDDLVADITEVLTSLCARWYGRSAAGRAEMAVAAAASEVSR